MTYKRWLITPLVLVVLAAASYAAWRQMQPPPLPEGLLYANGHIEGTEIDVGAEFAARVVEAAFDEGDAVEAHAVLVRLDDSVLAARKAEIEARIRALRASQRRVAAERRTAEHHRQTAATELARIQTLFGSGQASAQQRDAARNAEVEAAGRLAALQAREAELEAQGQAVQQQLRQVELRLEKTVIRAPSEGIVLVKGVEEGELATPGRLIARLVDLGRLELKVFVPESDLGKVRLGAPARVRVSAFPDRYFDARVASADQRAQFTPRDIHLPRERVRMVFGVTLALANPKGYLKLGMPADAWIRWRPEADWPSPLAVPR